MAANIRKCIDMGSINYPGDTTDVRYVHGPTQISNLTKIGQSGTRWVRLWVRWDKAEPTTQGSFDEAYLSAIDDQILQLRARNIYVMLVSWQFPQWTNGTQNLDEFDPNYERGHRLYQDGTGQLKSLKMQVPAAHLGVQGAWGQWIVKLYQRYIGWGVALEIMNEPNLQMWPQRAEPRNDAPLRIHQKVAEMMYTAYQISAYFGHQMWIAAPATSDFRRQSTVYETNYGEFIGELRNALASYNNFRGGPNFLWTQHAYKDTEDDNSAAVDWCRFILNAYGWQGWRNPADNAPGIWLTEAGARLHAISPSTYQRQSDLVARAIYRMTLTPGVAMYSNYLLHSLTSPYNQGLYDPITDANPQLRPVGTMFSGIPGYA